MILSTSHMKKKILVDTQNYNTQREKNKQNLQSTDSHIK